MDLVFLKTNQVHIFLCYFLFKCFPILLLVLFFIFRFNFILVRFNLGFLWSIVEGISNKGIIKTIRKSCEIFVGHAKSMTHFAWGVNISHGVRKFHTLCENKPTPAKSICIPCEIFADHAKNFAYPAPFCTPKAISHTMQNSRGMCENERSLAISF